MKPVSSSLKPGQGDVKLAGNPRGFGGRFPSLAATAVSGGVAAVLTQEFDVTFKVSIILTAVLTVILGIPEAVVAQSLSASDGDSTIVGKAYGQELGAATKLGGACAALVGLVASFLPGSNWPVAACVAVTNFTSVLCAGFYGVLVPRALRAAGLPAAFGPAVGLAITDLTTLVLYLCCATIGLLE